MSEGVREICSLVGGELIRGDPDRRLSSVMPADLAEPDAITFITKPKFLAALARSRAGAVLISPAMLAERGVEIAPSVAVIAVEHPYAAFAKVAQLFAPKVPAPAGIHPSAVIDPSAELGLGAAIGPFCFVGPRVIVGAGVVLHAGVHLEADAVIGSGTVLYNHVVVRHRCTIGARCVLHPGVVIGADGFGFAQEIEDEAIHHLKIPQIGTVLIEDDVEIGANSCVDRATLGTTRIGAGTKIDNLVQIGHNVEIGPGCILVAQSGVAGSSKLGSAVVMGAQSGVAGHVLVGDGALIYGQAGVINDVPPKEKVSGAPAVPAGEFFRNVVRVSRLEELMTRLRKVEKLLNGSQR